MISLVQKLVRRPSRLTFDVKRNFELPKGRKLGHLHRKPKVEDSMLQSTKVNVGLPAAISTSTASPLPGLSNSLSISTRASISLLKAKRSKGQFPLTCLELSSLITEKTAPS